MKRTNTTLTRLMAVVAAFAFAISSNAESAKARTGKVVRIKGAARFSTDGHAWQPLKVGTILKSGYVVQTAAESYADVVINEEASASGGNIATPTSVAPSTAAMGYRPVAEQDLLRIWDDTVLAFDNLKATDTGADRITETELDLRSGRIFGSVKKQAAASRFEIKIPNGVAGIRGTIFFISADGIAGCHAGSLIIAFTKSGSGDVGTQPIVAGFQFNVVTGELTPIPTSLLPIIQAFIQDAIRSQSRHHFTYVCDNTIHPVTRHKRNGDSEEVILEF